MKNTFKLLASSGLLASLLLNSSSFAVPRKTEYVRIQENKIFNAKEIADSFLEAGLPIDEVISYNSATDPNHLLGRPGYYTSKTDFRDLRHYDDNINDWEGDNHTIEVFSTTAAALARKQYVDRVTKGIPFLAQYQILRGRILIRIDRVMLPDEVQEYSEALDKMLR
jgi:hypothetical protein